jgi:hypothetical protein
MGISYDTLSRDLERFDNVEIVDIILKRAGGKIELKNIGGVLRSGVGRKFASFANIQVQTDDVVFNIPDVNIKGTGNPPNELNQDDEIVDSRRVRYTILAIDRPTFRTRWRCACRKVNGVL